MDNWNALFDLSPRFSLEITGSPLRPDVLNIKGREALSEPFCWTIEFTAPPGDIAPEQVLMKYASLRMRAGRAVHGVLTGLEWVSTTADQSHWRVTLESGLSLLSRTRRCAVFQNQSVPEVVEQVLRSHGFTGPDFAFRLARSYPPRGLITQWRETDLGFIRRLLAEVGIWFRSEMQAATETETLIFADGQAGYRFGVSLPYREPSGLYDGAAESVWDVRTRHEVVTGSAATRDYNYRAALTPQDSTVSVRSDAVTTGEHYRYAAPFREAGDDGDPEPATESGAFYARLHHERELNKSARVLLFSNACGLAPGQVLEPQGEVINALKEGVIITRVSFSAARDTRLHVLVSGMPYGERYCFRPEEIPRPVISGTLPARIESRERGDMYAHLDGYGRYRVRLDFDRADSEQGYAYLRLSAEKALTLTSTADVLFAGKKRITLSGGGSYLKIDANGVEYGTTGIYMRRMKLTGKRVKDAVPLESMKQMKMITQFFDRKIRFSSDVAYEIEDNNGKILASGRGNDAYVEKNDEPSEYWVFLC